MFTTMGTITAISKILISTSTLQFVSARFHHSFVLDDIMHMPLPFQRPFNFYCVCMLLPTELAVGLIVSVGLAQES